MTNDLAWSCPPPNDPAPLLSHQDRATELTPDTLEIATRTRAPPPRRGHAFRRARCLKPGGSTALRQRSDVPVDPIPLGAPFKVTWDKLPVASTTTFKSNSRGGKYV
jgi:hypothetical protein